MSRQKNIPRNKLGIPEYQMESLARALLPIVQKYLASEQRKQDYAEWKAKKDKKNNIEYENNSINEINGWLSYS